MKKSTLLLSALFLLLLNNCGSSIKGLMIYKIDPTLKSLTQVRSLPTQNAVGFEWEKIVDYRVHGVNIYRGTPTTGSQSFERIGSVGSRYATHFVDTNVKPNHRYLYTFTTFSLGKESNHGAVLKVQTQPPLKGVSFANAYAVAPTVVKLLWSPHANQSINRYVIERSVDNREWKYLIQVDGQLTAEYIDTFVEKGHSYKYRIIAKSYDEILTQSSPVISVSL